MIADVILNSSPVLNTMFVFQEDKPDSQFEPKEWTFVVFDVIPLFLMLVFKSLL